MQDAVIFIVSRDQSIRVPWEVALRDNYNIKILDVLTDDPELRGTHPQLVILDTSVIESDENNLARCIQSGCKVLVLGENWPESRQISVYAQGASGYCEINAPPEIARKSVETVLKGDVWIQRDLISKVIGTLVTRSKTAPATNVSQKKMDDALKMLSSREKEVVARIRTGESNRQVAEHLFISERTVKAHLSSIFRKLNLSDRLQLVIYLQQLDN
ncbi:MAG: response regulator transcription factor [Gammaproteobacteria bacterium]